MNADLLSMPATALERKIVRALRRLDVVDQAEILSQVVKLADTHDADMRFVAELSAEVRAA
jgi:hypothetical protein